MAVSVLNAKGWEAGHNSAVDNRHTYSLAAVETLDDIRRAQREQCSTSDSVDYLPLAKSGRRGPGRQHIAAADVTSTHEQHSAVEAPSLDPLQAAVRQTAQQLNARGIFDSDVNELRSRLMHMARQHRTLASRRPGQATIQTTTKPKLDENTTAGRLEAALQTVVNSIQPVPAPRTRKTTRSSHAVTYRGSTGSRCTTPAATGSTQGTSSPAHAGSPRSPHLVQKRSNSDANSSGSRPTTAQQRTGVWSLSSGTCVTAASPLGLNNTGPPAQGFGALPDEQNTIWEAPEGRCSSAGSSGMDAAGREEQAAAREDLLRTQLGSAAYAEHLETRQAATEGRLQLYRAQVHQRQQALLNPGTAHAVDAGTGSNKVAVGAGNGSKAAAVGAGAVAAGARSEAATDQAMATMQQLVAHLVAKDVAPTKQDQPDAAPAAAPSPAELERAAASARLMAATRLPDLIAATEAHTRLLTQDLFNTCGMNVDPSAPLSPRSTARLWRSHVQQAQQQEQALEAAIGSDDWLAAAARSHAGPITNLLAAKLQAAHAPRQGLAAAAADATPRAAGKVTFVSGVWGAAEPSVSGLGSSEGSYGEGGPLSAAPSYYSSAGGRQSAAAARRGTVAGGANRKSAAGARSSAAGGARQRKGPPPQLQPPSEDEVASIPMPSLPALLDLSHDPAHVLLARLERVWEVLGVPAPQRMDMVLRYTSRAAVLLFEPALESWEQAAAAVLQREGLLGELLQLRQELDTAADARASGAKAAAARKMIHYSVEDCSQLMWAFLVATEQVHFTATQLQQQWDEALCVDGEPYPAQGAAGAEELQALLVEAWEVLE